MDEPEEPKGHPGTAGPDAATSGTPPRVSAETLQHYLRGIDYPAPRNKLIAVALENSAPAEVIASIRGLPETADFRTEADLLMAWRDRGP